MKGMNKPETPFLEAKNDGEVVIIGLPLDATLTYRPGTSLAPNAMREVSEVLETYSPYLHLDMNDLSFTDKGDLPLAGDLMDYLECIQKTAEDLMEEGKRLLALGGEHLISLPLVKACLKRWPDLVVIHMDAHMDLRNRYEGRHLSHATVMRRIWEAVDGRVYQLGIRSGTREEWAFSKQHCRLCPFDLSSTKAFLDEIGERPFYLTLDLDLLDPGYLPGTGTPECGGINSRELFSALPLFYGKQMVGADLVELSPAYDPTGASSVLGAKVVRELLLLLGNSRGPNRDP